RCGVVKIGCRLHFPSGGIRLRPAVEIGRWIVPPRLLHRACQRGGIGVPALSALCIIIAQPLEIERVGNLRRRESTVGFQLVLGVEQLPRCRAQPASGRDDDERGVAETRGGERRGPAALADAPEADAPAIDLGTIAQPSRGGGSVLAQLFVFYPREVAAGLAGTSLVVLEDRKALRGEPVAEAEIRLPR